MPKGIPQRDPGAAYQRKVAAERRFPPGGRCGCGEIRPEALIPNSDPLVCAACDRAARGESAWDKHHVAGRRNSPVTIAAPVNDHRAGLSPAQYDWPKSTLKNPTGSPLLARAACIRGFVDTNSYLVEKLLLPHAEFCELMEEFLTEKYGSDWSVGMEQEKFKPKP